MAIRKFCNTFVIPLVTLGIVGTAQPGNAQSKFDDIWEFANWYDNAENRTVQSVKAEFNPEEADPFYKRFTDFYVEWARSDALALTVGKQGVPFTMDGQTSSKELLTIDRSNLANNMWFPEEYIPGVSVSGLIGRWVYQFGGFSGGEKNREFGRFNGSAFGLASLGYDLSERFSSE
jgi:phosphate-selective porin